jgi:hypothetical protein
MTDSPCSLQWRTLLLMALNLGVILPECEVNQLQSVLCNHVIKIACLFLKNNSWFRDIHSSIKIHLLIVILLLQLSSMVLLFSKRLNTNIPHKVSL